MTTSTHCTQSRKPESFHGFCFVLESFQTELEFENSNSPLFAQFARGAPDVSLLTKKSKKLRPVAHETRSQAKSGSGVFHSSQFKPRHQQQTKFHARGILLRIQNIDTPTKIMNVLVNTPTKERKQ